MIQKRFITSIVFLGLVFLSIAEITPTKKISYPESFFTFREAVYNNNGKVLNDFIPLYNELNKAALSIEDPYTQLITLSRSQYLLGRAFEYLGEKLKSGDSLDKGVEYVKEALSLHETAEAYTLYAYLISQNCVVKSTGYAITEGAKISKLTKKALEIDPTNGAAFYQQNAENAYMPSPFNNYKKAITNMTILANTNTYSKDEIDVFNALSAIAYVLIQQEKNDEARTYINKALEIFPKNKYLIDLIPQ